MKKWLTKRRRIRFRYLVAAGSVTILAWLHWTRPPGNFTNFYDRCPLGDDR